MPMHLDLSRLPRTVELLRDGEGRACFAFVDQRELPDNLVVERTADWRELVCAVKSLAVRGAPALGICGAAAVALWADEAACVHAEGPCDPAAAARAEVLDLLDEVCLAVAGARPTAVNLSWGVAQARERIVEPLRSGLPLRQAADAAFAMVKDLEAQDEACCRAIGEAGAALLPKRPGGCRVLTHCNAGSLACSFYGTALGVVYSAAAQGRLSRVYADETRPVGQGARLTAWELARAGVPVTLICDDMAASVMAQGMVDAVVVGADRIAANGDTANKIGTLGVAVLARHFGIPLFVAAPTSTIDRTLADGALIPIEQRDPAEVAKRPPEGVEVYNPAFDVTPASLIAAVVTEKGAFAPGDVLSALQG